jgi:hypothetical protein
MMPSTNPAHVYELVALIVIFFLTSVIGVVTGSNSLITVPAMLAFGIEPRVALATNMFGLMFMSLGGTLPFARFSHVGRFRFGCTPRFGGSIQSYAIAHFYFYADCCRVLVVKA